MKVAVCLALMAMLALWADKASDLASIEATVAALATSPYPPKLYAARFPNAPELQRLLWEGASTPAPLIPTEEGETIKTQTGTLIISHQPMGEASWRPAITLPTPPAPHFVMRSVKFNFRRHTAVVVATYVNLTSEKFGLINERNTAVQFGLKREGSEWRIASFRVLPEAQTQATR